MALTTGLANDLRRVAHSRAGVMSALELLVLDRAANALDQGGAPRQAGTETQDGQLRQTEYGDHATLRALGIAVRVGTKVPTGAAVRLDVHDAAIWLEPEEAKRLSVALDIAAIEAVYEDRAARRG